MSLQCSMSEAVIESDKLLAFAICTACVKLQLLDHDEPSTRGIVSKWWLRSLVCSWYAKLIETCGSYLLRAAC